MKTALIVIDMQNGFINKKSAQCIPDAEATVPLCAELIEHCRAKGIPVFFVNRRYRCDGSDVEAVRYASWAAGGKAMSGVCPGHLSDEPPAEFGVCENDYLIIKPRFSAFFGTELDLILRRKRIDTLILIGTTTPNCIRSTCYDALSLDYNTLVISDCTSSRSKQVQEANLEDMAYIGAQVMTAREFMSGAVPVVDVTGAVYAALENDSTPPERQA